MQVIKREKIEYVLSMTKEEKDWLQLTMQNPLHGQTPENEGSSDNEHRRNLWEELASSD